MCAALLSPNYRDAFLRLSQLPSLRDWRFYSAILLAETQECVSTTFRRTQVNTSADKASIKSRWKPLDLFEALPVILPPNTCQLFPWDRIVRCLQLPAAPRGTRIVRQFLPAAPRGTRIAPRNLAAIRERQESRCETFPPFGRDKNRAAKPCRRVVWVRKQCFQLAAEWFGARNACFSFPAALHGARFARQFLPAAWREKKNAARGELLARHALS